MIEKIYIDKLRQLPIEQVADALGMGIRWHNALCPFHNDSHPSLHFSSQHNTYHCYVCGAHGGTIDLVMHRQNLKFQEACRWLADAFGVYIGESGATDRNSRRMQQYRAIKQGTEASSDGRSSVSSEGRSSVSSEGRSEVSSSYFVDTEYLSLYVSHPVLSSEAEHFLFEERRLSRKVIEWCRVSSITTPTPCTRFGKPFYDAPSLLIPYFDKQGRLQSVQSRYLGGGKKGLHEDGKSDLMAKDIDRKEDLKEKDIDRKEDLKAKGVARFKFPKGSQCHIYNLPILRWLKPGEELFITEGCTDCWAMMSTGRKAIAIPSATLLKPEDIEPLSRLNLHIFPDQDGPGERLYLELKDRLPQLQRHQLPEGCKDFSDYYLTLI